MKRLFDVSHSKVLLNVDLAQERISGTATLTINPHEQTLKQLRFNSRQNTITNILVDGIQATFSYHNQFNPINKPQIPTSNDLRLHYSAPLEEGDEGELVINTPPEFSVKTLVGNSQQADEQDETVQMAVCLAPFQVKIFWTCSNPKSGLFFFNQPGAFPHMFTYNQVSSTRFWMPCIDNFQEKCTWEIHISVAISLVDLIESSDNMEIVSSQHRTPQHEHDERTHDLIAVCSGQLYCHSTLLELRKRIFSYRIDTPTSACSIVLAVGPFKVIKIPGWEASKKTTANPTDRVPDEDISAPEPTKTPFALSMELLEGDGGYALCFPGLELKLQYTVEKTQQQMDFVVNHVNAAYPFSSFKLVFVDECYTSVMTGAGIIICSNHLLVSPDIIDQVYVTSKLICRGIVAQWFGHFIVPKAWVDAWLFVGLCNYISSLYSKKRFGNNEWKYSLKKDMDKICELDVNQPPLYPTVFVNATEGQELNIDPFLIFHFHPDDAPVSPRAEFLALKSAVVLYMMDRRMGKGQLQKVINKIIMANISQELQDGLSTRHFLRICTKTTKSNELKNFANQWIYGAGVPRFVFSWQFNRKKMCVDFLFKQDNVRDLIHGNNNDDDLGGDQGTKMFIGPFNIRVHEPNGPINFEVDIEENEKTFEIPYHSKYRAPKKRDDETVDSDQGCLDWIRLDPENEWLCIKIFEQSAFMWNAQLIKDRDVVAQTEALEAIARQGSLKSCGLLSKVINDGRMFYRIRIDACFALTKCVPKDLERPDKPLPLLRQYRDKYCVSPTIGPIDPKYPYVPRSNQFSSLQKYFIQKGLITSMSLLKNVEGLSFRDVRIFLLELLRYNDNNGNMFADNFFLASLIEAIGNSFMPATNLSSKLDLRQIKVPSIFNAKTNGADNHGIIEEEFNFQNGSAEDVGVQPVNKAYIGKEDDVKLFWAAFKEIDRYRNLDRVLSSYHNTVTVACLEVFLKWMLVGLIPTDLILYLNHSRYGNFLQVRLISVDSLLLLEGLSNHDVLLYLLSLMESDHSLFVRYYVSQALVNITNLSCGIIAEDEFLHKSRLRSSLSFDNLRTRLLKDWNNSKNTFVRNGQLLDKFWNLLSPNQCLDNRIRRNILRFLELVCGAASDAFESTNIPKLKFKMPVANPVIVRQDDESSDEEEAFTLQSYAKIKITAKPRSEIDPLFVSSCSELLNMLFNHPQAAHFIFPVDASLAPAYYTIVKNPMDLTNIRRKLDIGSYNNEIQPLMSDIRQIFSNCYSYNQDSSPIFEQAKILESFFENEVVPLLSNVSNSPEDVNDFVPAPANKYLDKFNKLLKSLNNHRVAHWFRLPVDPVLQKIPTYYKVIKSPMDLSTVKNKVSFYSTPTSFKRDIDLIFDNALLFNPPHSPVYKDALTLKAYFDNKFFEAFPNFVVDQVMSTDDRLFCEKVLNKMKSREDIVLPFLYPISKIDLPIYYAIIDSPMDIGTITNKLSSGVYKSKHDFERDMGQMFTNCFTFNQTGSPIYNMGKSLEKLFNTEWKNQSKRILSSPSTEIDTKKKDISTSEIMKQCLKILQNLKSHQSAPLFAAPVDAIALGVPNYYDVVKNPMDLSTVEKKLHGKLYVGLDDFEEDVRLIFYNCFLFNLPDDDVYLHGQSIEAFFNKEMAALKKKVTSAATPVSSNTTPATSGNPPVAKIRLTIPQSKVVPAEQPLFIESPSPVLQHQSMIQSEIVNEGEPDRQEQPLEEIVPQPQQHASSSSAEIPASPATIQPFLPLPLQQRPPIELTLSPSDKEKVLRLYQKLLAFKDVRIFTHPVDSQLYPDYYVKITHPIDLTSIHNNIPNYADLHEFDADMKLLFANCKRYNAKGSWAHGVGVTFERLYKKEWKGIFGKELKVKKEEIKVKEEEKPKPTFKLKLKF